MTKKSESPLLFNYEDVEQKAQAYLEHIRGQGRAILEKAVAEANAACEKIFHEAEEKRTAAQREGFQKGYQKGYEEGAARREEEISKIVQEEVLNGVRESGEMYRHVLETLQQSRCALIESWERNFLAMVCLVSQTVIRKELANDPDIERRWIREMLERCTGESELHLRLNPDDAARLKRVMETFQTEIRGLGKLDIREDSTLALGDCVLDTEFGTLDQRVSAQLERIAEELQT